MIPVGHDRKDRPSESFGGPHLRQGKLTLSLNRGNHENQQIGRAQLFFDRALPLAAFDVSAGEIGLTTKFFDLPREPSHEISIPGGRRQEHTRTSLCHFVLRIRFLSWLK